MSREPLEELVTLYSCPQCRKKSLTKGHIESCIDAHVLIEAQRELMRNCLHEWSYRTEEDEALEDEGRITIVDRSCALCGMEEKSFFRSEDMPKMFYNLFNKD